MLERFWHRRDDDEGFTLIELMVVVLIIGILIAIALPTFLGARARAQDRAAQSNLRNGIAAAKVFFTDADLYTGFDATAADLIEPSLVWDDAGGTVVNTADIAVAATASVVVLQTESASGTSFCVSDDATTGTTYGTDTAGGNFTAATCADPSW